METFVGDTVKLVIFTSIDLTGNTTLIIKYKKPDGTTGFWTASIVAGSPTYLEYTTVTGDLDVNGVWVLQAYVEYGGGTTIGHGLWAKLTVYDPIY